MVYRIFVEKKKELAHEAAGLYSELKNLLGIKNLESVRVLNRYDADDISAEVFEAAKSTVFSEPQLDIISDELVADGYVFAVEFLPGQLIRERIARRSASRSCPAATVLPFEAQRFTFLAAI